MNNKYVYMLVAGIFGAVWYMVATMGYYGMDGGISDNWTWATIIAIGLGAGNTGGDDAVSILKEGVMGSVNMLIAMAVYIAIGHLVYYLVSGTSIDVNTIIHGVATYVAAGLLTNVFMSYLKKSIA